MNKPMQTSELKVLCQRTAIGDPEYYVGRTYFDPDQGKHFPYSRCSKYFECESNALIELSKIMAIIEDEEDLPCTGLPGALPGSYGDQGIARRRVHQDIIKDAIESDLESNGYRDILIEDFIEPTSLEIQKAVMRAALKDDIDLGTEAECDERCPGKEDCSDCDDLLKHAPKFQKVASIAGTQYIDEDGYILDTEDDPDYVPDAVAEAKRLRQAEDELIILKSDLGLYQDLVAKYDALLETQRDLIRALESK